MKLERKIKLARGEEKADLLLKNCRLVNVFSGRIEETSVALSGDIIVGIGDYRAEKTVDCKGEYLAPGFMDGHVHIESSMITVPEYARAVVPHGTTTVIIDPHEIANVFGLNGIRYMINSSRRAPLNVFVMLSSCVPASELETSGARLNSRDLSSLWGETQVLGLAEMMNYPGVLFRDPEVMTKLRSAAGRPIDGHAPGLSGKDLNAYAAAGILSDHECTTAAEAEEKLARGLYIMLREGTAAKNLEDLLPVCRPDTCRRCLLATDDRHPSDLLTEGHIDFMIRKAVAGGIDPVDAVRMATLNTAEYFKLEGLGAIAPGYRADLVVFNNFKNLRISRVFKSGKLVARDGKMIEKRRRPEPSRLRGSINVNWLEMADLDIPARGDKIRVIEIIPGQLVTREKILKPRLKDKKAVADIKRDILKIAVIERHLASGDLAVGFVRGFGLKTGALASSVAHDSHNIIVVGTNDDDMMTAAIEISRLGGGQVVVDNGEVTAALPLPIAGLMSPAPLEEVCEGVEDLNRAAHELGCGLKDPFMTLSFLALPPIPELKITDRGLIDAVRFQPVPLFVKE